MEDVSENKNEVVLWERIAIALGRIATILEQQGNEALNITSNNQNPNSVEEITDLKNEIKVDTLIEKLKDYGISVRNYPEQESENSVLDSISNFMGTYYTDIKEVYERIKTSLNSAYDITLNMKSFPQSSVSASCQFCNRLYEIAFLSKYQYFKSPTFTIKATPNKIPPAINFLTGHWLECFVKNTMQKIILSIPYQIEYTYIVNPQIILPNGDDFELDVVFLINNNLYWIEAKTTSYQNYIDKYSKIAKMVGFTNKKFLVLTEKISSETILHLEKTFNFKIIYVVEFEQQMKEVLLKDIVI